MSKTKLNLACGQDVRHGYINVDKHTEEEIVTRYGRDKPLPIGIHNFDIFDLPFEDDSVDEVLCLSAMEHFSFEEEKKFFYEVRRVLKPGGKFIFEVPDFDYLFKLWLEAKDEFVDFYKVGTEEHWFGQGNRNVKNKWGYLAAHIFGNQNGEGQFHKNAYTPKKVMTILNKLGFYYQMKTVFFKGTTLEFIHCEAVKMK
jgi:predicted SAM-dependent methyltransferase